MLQRGPSRLGCASYTAAWSRTSNRLARSKCRCAESRRWYTRSQPLHEEPAGSNQDGHERDVHGVSPQSILTSKSWTRAVFASEDRTQLRQEDMISGITTTTHAVTRPSHNKLSAVVLLTKAYANWAIDEEFLRLVITQALKATTDPTRTRSDVPPLQVDALVAVVDAIPKPGLTYCKHYDIWGEIGAVAPEERSLWLKEKLEIGDPLRASPVFDDGHEGMAISFSGHEEQTPLETVDELSSATGPRTPSSSEAQATLTFAMRQLDTGDTSSRNVKLPLAKTLFYNGLQHTMLSSSWVENSATARFEIVRRQHHQHALVTIPLQPPLQPDAATIRRRWFVTTPLLPLTPPRVVTASMGNIIRQIGDREDPASQELEVAVVKFFEDNDMPVQAAAVWALVIPKETAANLEAEGALDAMHADPEGQRMTMIVKAWNRTTKVNTQQPRDIFSSLPYLLMLRGARLHKVLSGGGGWGKKAGLLSLDPESDYSSADPTAPPRLLDLDGLLDEPSPVKTVAAPGDFVRFYISPNLPEDAFPLPMKDLRRGRVHRQQSIEFGVLPSRMDEIETTNTGSPLGVQSNAGPVFYTNRHFGALSEGGMSMEVKDRDGEVIMRSKVDVPYARFSYQFYGYGKPNKLGGGVSTRPGAYQIQQHRHAQQKATEHGDGVPLEQALRGRLDATTPEKRPEEKSSPSFQPRKVMSRKRTVF